MRLIVYINLHTRPDVAIYLIYDDYVAICKFIFVYTIVSIFYTRLSFSNL